MEIIYRKGDLIKSGLKYIAHGCNAQGVMGSGIAKQIKFAYPQNYVTYVKSWARHYEMDFPFLGEVVLHEHNKNRSIFNCITQENYGRGFEGKQFVSYEAMRKCFASIDKHCQLFHMMDPGYPEVGFPRIGCSLGGGSWDVVSKILVSESNFFQPVVFDI